MFGIIFVDVGWTRRVTRVIRVIRFLEIKSNFFPFLGSCDRRDVGGSFFDHSSLGNWHCCWLIINIITRCFGSWICGLKRLRGLHRKYVKFIITFEIWRFELHWALVRAHESLPHDHLRSTRWPVISLNTWNLDPGVQRWRCVKLRIFFLFNLPFQN